MKDIEKILIDGNSVQIKPQGYSMYPMFFPGRDEAIIDPVSIDNIKKGDVILYRRKGSILVMHRVMKIRTEGIYFVGDNQEKIEGPLPLTCVRGKLSAFIRNGKYISVSNPIYRFTASIWLFLRPVRGYIKRTTVYIKRIFIKNN